MSSHRPRHPHRRHGLWLLPVLAATVPAFYQELLRENPGFIGSLAYGAAALATAIDAFVAWRRPRMTPTAPAEGDASATLTRLRRRAAAAAGEPLRRRFVLDALLVLGFSTSAALPPSSHSEVALTVRLVVAMATLARMMMIVSPWIVRGRFAHMLAIAAGLLVLAALGYRGFEPMTPTFADALWLTFVSAATVGYGDLVPSTPASRILTVFVVMIGFGVLSLITAWVAARWVGQEESRIEQEILRDLHVQLDGLRRDIAALRREIGQSRAADVANAPHPPPNDG